MGVSNDNPSIGELSVVPPENATQIAGTDGTNLETPRVFDTDTGGGEEFVLGANLRASAPGGSVETGTTAHPLRVDPTGTTTQPVSTTQLPAALVGGRLDENVGAWLGSTLPTVGQKVSASSIPMVIASDQSAVPVSGTMTANQGTPAITANAWPTKVTDGTNTAVVKAASTAPVAADPSLVVTISPNSSTPVTPVTTATGALGALNAAVTIALAGQSSAGFQLSAGTLIGTLTPELSFDGGTTWNAGFLDDVNSALTTSLVFTAANTAQFRSLAMMGGATHARIRVSAFTSGTANLTLSADQTTDTSVTLTSTSATGTLNALNAAATVLVSGQRSVGFQLAAGTLIGTILPELSFDGGTTWSSGFFNDFNFALAPSIVFTAANAAQARSIPMMGGVTHARVRVSAFTSGTAGIVIGATQQGDATVVTAPTDGFKRTYSAACLGLVPPATPTDIFTITGATGIITRVTRITISGTRTANGTSDIVLIKRSTANTGGTSVARTAIPYDSQSSAGQSTVLTYTVNPTLGTAVGPMLTAKIFLQTAAAGNPSGIYVFQFGGSFPTSIVLRGTSEVLAINMNGATVAGNSFDISIEWTEETAP